MKHGFQRKLSRSMGLSEAQISRICSRKQVPSWDQAKRLAAITNTTPYVWLEGSADDLARAVAENWQPVPPMEAA